MLDEKHEERIAPFKRLWKTEDKVWLEDRAADWKIIAENNLCGWPKKELANLRKFFLTGSKSDYISETMLLVCTPFNSPDEVKELFFSNLFGRHEKEVLLNGFMGQCMQYLDGIPWKKNHITLFVDHIFGREYRSVLDDLSCGGSGIKYPEPTFWCFSFCGDVRNVFKNQKDQYHYVMDLVNYFISALPFARKEKFRKCLRLEDIFIRVNRVLEEGAPEMVVEFAKELKKNESVIMANWNMNNEGVG